MTDDETDGPMDGRELAAVPENGAGLQKQPGRELQRGHDGSLVSRELGRAKAALSGSRYSLGPLLLVGLAIIVMLVILGQQRAAMNRQLQAMRAQTEIMASQLSLLQQAAQQSAQIAQSGRVAAEAAQQSAQAAGQALWLTQRAYLVPRPPELINLSNRPLSIQTAFDNQGATAAEDVVMSYGQVVFQDTDDLHIDFSKAPKTSGSGASSGGGIAPHGERQVGYVSEAGVSADDMRKLTTGHGSLMIFGSAAYSDVFAKPHFAHFCKMFQFDTYGNQVRTQPCPTWNDSE